MEFQTLHKCTIVQLKEYKKDPIEKLIQNAQYLAIYIGKTEN